MNTPERLVFLVHKNGVDYFIDEAGDPWQQAECGMIKCSHIPCTRKFAPKPRKPKPPKPPAPPRPKPAPRPGLNPDSLMGIAMRGGMN
jgi:hypothetical protein